MSPRTIGLQSQQYDQVHNALAYEWTRVDWFPPYDAYAQAYIPYHFCAQASIRVAWRHVDWNWITMDKAPAIVLNAVMGDDFGTNNKMK